MKRGRGGSSGPQSVRDFVRDAAEEMGLTKSDQDTATEQPLFPPILVPQPPAIDDAKVRRVQAMRAVRHAVAESAYRLELRAPSKPVEQFSDRYEKRRPPVEPELRQLGDLRLALLPVELLQHEAGAGGARAAAAAAVAAETAQRRLKKLEEVEAKRGGSGAPAPSAAKSLEEPADDVVEAPEEEEEDDGDYQQDYYRSDDEDEDGGEDGGVL